MPTESFAKKDIGVGALLYNLNKTTTSPDASTSLTGPMLYPFQFRMDWMAFGYNFSPRFAYTFIPRETSDSAAKTNVIMLSLPMTGQIGMSPDWKWLAGLGISLYQVKGNGGTVVLNNGTGTSTFNLPERTSLSKNFLIETGATYDISPGHRLDTELHFGGIMSKRLTYHFMLSYNYAFGEGSI